MIAALIVAAGQGVRMGTSRRKQYLPLGDHAILTHTLKAFDACPRIERIVISVPEEDMAFCRNTIIDAAVLRAATLVAPGGPRRQDSVCNGLQALSDDVEIVLIHDGVRPLVSVALIDACIQGAQRWDACIPAVAVTDTLKKVDCQGAIRQTIPRQGLYMAQTPQAFRLALIKEAHRRALIEGWQATDDASLVERMGTEVHVIPGSPGNIKITTPEDLRWAEILEERRKMKEER